VSEVTIRQAAQALGVSVSTVRQRVKRGVLPSRRDELGVLLVTVPDVALKTARSSARRGGSLRDPGPIATDELERPSTDGHGSATDHSITDVTLLEGEAVSETGEEGERRRISDYLGDVKGLREVLEVERKRNAELVGEVEFQRRRIERDEDARQQLMQLLDNTQRLLGNAQAQVQRLLGPGSHQVYDSHEPEHAQQPEAERPTATSRWLDRLLGRARE
jgi:DNA-binding transcriptional MerR regulator